MIYLDHAATSLPKPSPVLRETLTTLTTPPGNPGRSGHRLSLAGAEAVFSARETLSRLVGADGPHEIVFTGGATAALNLAIKGFCLAFLREGILPLAVTDVFEHNSVLRPLFDLEREGLLTLKILSPEENGNLSRELLLHLRPQILVLTCRSNTTGHRFFLRDTVEQLKKTGTVVILDGAQMLGSGPCTLASTGASVLCAPSHKGLLGYMGAGLMAFSSSLPLLPVPLLSGGSGSDSFSREMPTLLPERLEAGTLPLPAIVSMAAGAEYLMKTGTEKIEGRERECKRLLREGMESLGSYVIYEPEYPDGPLLVNRKNTSCQELAAKLEEKGVLVRAGFHCAPLAHRYLGTEKQGAVRFSPGWCTTPNEILQTLRILERLEGAFS